MPYKPKKPCAYSGCPNLTPGTHCNTHRKAEAKRYNRYERVPDTAKHYGSAWKKVRTAYLSTNPLCEMCRRESYLVPASLVHHIRFVEDGGTDEKSNLTSLCVSCHETIHRKQKR
ncbi:HNH endonuclease [Clostridia bacterium]|nr:HNH endonuclease [Clostridia bacterium]